MFYFFRKYYKIFIWLIVLSFIVWGASSIALLDYKSSSYAGKIGNEHISLKEFQTTLRFFDLLLQTMKSRASDKEKEPAKPPSFEEIRGLTWQTLILSREAKKKGITVSDEEVAAEIRKQFSDGTNFNQMFYQTWIRNQYRGEPRDFEEAFRKHLATQKLRAEVLKDVPEKDQPSKWMGWLIPVMSKAKVVDYSAEKSQP